jgi:hypothetical protein
VSFHPFSHGSGGVGVEPLSPWTVRSSSSRTISCRSTTWKATSWMCVGWVSGGVAELPDLSRADRRVLGDGLVPSLGRPGSLPRVLDSP